jgi:hypothetical protein
MIYAAATAADDDDSILDCFVDGNYGNRFFAKII